MRLPRGRAPIRWTDTVTLDAARMTHFQDVLMVAKIVKDGGVEYKDAVVSIILRAIVTTKKMILINLFI